MVWLPRLFSSSCSIPPQKPEGCLLKVENNRRQRTQVSLSSFCDNSGNHDWCWDILGAYYLLIPPPPHGKDGGWAFGKELGAMRILLLQLAGSVKIYKVATCYVQYIPASLGPGDKGQSSTIPSSPQWTFIKDEIGTVKVPRSWLQALLSLVNWHVVWYHWNRQDCKRNHSQAIASFPQKLSCDWYTHLRMEHTHAMNTPTTSVHSFIHWTNSYWLAVLCQARFWMQGIQKWTSRPNTLALYREEKNWEHLSQMGCCFFHSFLFLYFDTSFQGGPNSWFDSVCLRMCRLFYHRTALHRKLS